MQSVRYAPLIRRLYAELITSLPNDASMTLNTRPAAAEFRLCLRKVFNLTRFGSGSQAGRMQADELVDGQGFKPNFLSETEFSHR